MTIPRYNPEVPQAYPNTGSLSQPSFLTNFTLLNQFFGTDHIPFAASIVSMNNNAVTTTIISDNHLLTSGGTITIYVPLEGGYLVESNLPKKVSGINGTGPYTVTVIDEDTFTIPLNSSGFTPYIQDGYWTTSSNTYPYGQHKLFDYPIPQTQDPNSIAPAASVYTKQAPDRITSEMINMVTQLFFQNGNAASNVTQLIGHQFKIGTPAGHFGFKTPFNIILNFGEISLADPVTGLQVASLTVTFPISYTANCFSVIMFSISPNPVREFASVVGLNSFLATGGFAGQGSSGIFKFYYLAIGR